MEHVLLQLPPELLNLIYNLCRKKDLVSLSCCSTQSYHSVKYLLWNTVEIPIWILAQDKIHNINLENFKLTCRLQLRSHGYKTLQRFDWDSAVHNYKTLLEHCSNKRLVSLEIDGLINDNGLIMTCNILKNLEEVSLYNCKDISDVGWSYLGCLPHLKKLRLTGCCINDSGIEKLVESGCLIDFRLVKCSKITERCLRHINGLIRMMNLKINRRTNLLADGLKSHSTAPSSVVDLDDSRMTDQAMVYISHLKSLRSLVVDGYNNNITDVGLFYLSKLTILKTLSLINCVNITDYGLSHITSFLSLKTLDMSGCIKIQDGGLNHISSLTSLRHLDISYCKLISDIGIKYLTKLPSLKYLNMSHCSQVTDRGISYLTVLSCLVDLNLNYCIRITDIGLHQLSKLQSLQYLYVCGCKQLTDSGLCHLADLALIKLDLSYCGQISDVGIYHIRKMRTLKDLVIDNCSNITNIPRLLI